MAKAPSDTATEKVKIFTAGDKPVGFPHLEEEINEWLDKNPNIEITNRMMSTLAGRSEVRAAQRNDDGNFMNLTIVVFYRNK